MITDKEHLFSDTQDLDVVGLDGGTITSTNEYDLGPMGSPTVGTWENLNSFAIGTGEQLYVHVMVDEDFAGGTSVQFRLVSDATVGQTDAGDQTLADSGAIVIATLVDGYEFFIAVNPHVETDRYVRMAYTGVGTFTAGMVTASLVCATSGLKAYGSALSI